MRVKDQMNIYDLNACIWNFIARIVCNILSLDLNRFY
jgi:hypothetical protein